MDKPFGALYCRRSESAIEPVFADANQVSSYALLKDILSLSILAICQAKIIMNNNKTMKYTWIIVELDEKMGEAGCITSCVVLNITNNTPTKITFPHAIITGRWTRNNPN